MSVAELSPTIHLRAPIAPYSPHIHPDGPVSQPDYDASFTVWERDVPQEQSIFESYSPINDAERLQSFSKLSSEEKDYYINENVISYLEEFVGKISVKKLSGILKADGRLTMLGTDITDMYRESAHIAGLGSREYMEGKGLDMIAEQINQGANRALWISPPKLAAYGFVFTFIAEEYDEGLDGRPIREVLLRYDEDFHSVEESTRIYKELQVGLTPQEFQNNKLLHYEDFLASPITYRSENDLDLDYLHKVVGISGEDIERSESFRKNILPKITPWLKRYSALVQELSQYDLTQDSDFIKSLNTEGEMMIGAMFNTARAVDRLMNEDYASLAQYHQDQNLIRVIDSSWNSQEMIMYAAQQAYQSEALMITGGSNCPVTQVGEREVSLISGMEIVSIGESMQRIGLEANTSCGKKGCSNRTPHFHCPEKKQGGCGGPIDKGKGIEICPHCKLKKSDLKEQCD